MTTGTVHQVNLSAPPQALQVAPGDSISITAEFDYIGPAVTGAKIRVAMFSWSLIDPHNEKAFEEFSFDMPDSPDPGNHIKVKNLVIKLPSSGLPEGLRYGLYVKVFNVVGKEWFAYIGENDPPYYQWIIDVIIPPQGEYALTISVSPSGAGYVVKSPDQLTYPPGTTVTLTAVPAAGYYFDRWGGDVSGNSVNVTVNMSGNKSVTAVFKKESVQYTLITSVSPSGSGSVIRNPDQAMYTEGTFVVLTAAPASGYYFDHWEGDASGSSAAVGVRMNANLSVTAVFKPETGGEEYFTVAFAVDPPEGGYLEPEPWLVQYKKYDVVKCTIYANVGWTIDHWTVNGTTYTGWSIYVTVTKDVTVTAHVRRK